MVLIICYFLSLFLDHISSRFINLLIFEEFLFFSSFEHFILVYQERWWHPAPIFRSTSFPFPITYPPFQPLTFVFFGGICLFYWCFPLLFTWCFMDMLVGVFLTQQKPGSLRRRSLNWENVSVELACRQVCGLFSWLMIDVQGHCLLWEVPPLGRLSWVL